MKSKPPLGVPPDNIWRERRAMELVGAMGRYADLLDEANAENAEAARDLIDRWAKELVALNLPQAMPF